MTHTRPTYTVDRFGGLGITYPDGMTAYLQPGDEANNLADEIDRCETDEQQSRILWEYWPVDFSNIELRIMADSNPIPPVRTQHGDHWPTPSLPRVPRAVWFALGILAGSLAAVVLSL